VQKSGQTLLDLSYDYNRNNSIGSLNGKTGHLTKIINNLDANKNREYEFDALGRLTKAKGGNGGNLWTQNYSYDRYGNRESITATGVAADGSAIPRDGIANLSYNTSNNRITTTGFEYDSAGNQTRALAEDGTWLKFEYDAANRLRVVKKDIDGTYLQAFQYGSTNARLMDLDYQYGYLKIFASSSGTTLAEYTEFAGAIPTWTKSYTYLGDRLLSTISPNGTNSEYTEYNHPDKLGTRFVTNQASGTSYEQTTLPFGIALNAESTGSNSKRFTSYERSAGTGLDYAVNRTYDSKQGRFTQIDPIGMKAVNLELPQTLNLYNYCGNDPVNQTDPDGLFWGAIGRFFQMIGRAIRRILGNIVVQIAINFLAAIVTFGTSLVATLSVFMPGLLIPTWLAVTSAVLTAASWASKIGTALELTGLLLERKFKQLGKIIGLAFVGALVGVVEDSIINGVTEAIKNGGNIFAGAWKGFKDGLHRLKTIFTRKFKDFFIAVYGFFCGPGYGVENQGYPNSQDGVDGRDKACKAHDEALKQRELDLLAGLPVRSKTYYDWKLIKSNFIATSIPHLTDIAFGGGHRIGNVFGFTVPFAFGIRILKNRGK